MEQRTDAFYADEAFIVGLRVLQYMESGLCGLMSVDLVPPLISLVALTCFEHAVGEPCNIPCNRMPRIVFGNSLGQEILVIFADRVVVTTDNCHGS